MNSNGANHGKDLEGMTQDEGPDSKSWGKQLAVYVAGTRADLQNNRDNMFFKILPPVQIFFPFIAVPYSITEAPSCTVMAFYTGVLGFMDLICRGFRSCGDEYDNAPGLIGTLREYLTRKT